MSGPGGWPGVRARSRSHPDDVRAEERVAVRLGGRQRGVRDDRFEVRDLGETAEAARPEFRVYPRENQAPRDPDDLSLDVRDGRVRRGETVLAGDAVGP